MNFAPGRFAWNPGRMLGSRWFRFVLAASAVPGAYCLLALPYELLIPGAVLLGGIMCGLVAKVSSSASLDGDDVRKAKQCVVVCLPLAGLVTCACFAIAGARPGGCGNGTLSFHSDIPATLMVAALAGRAATPLPFGGTLCRISVAVAAAIWVLVVAMLQMPDRFLPG